MKSAGKPFIFDMRTRSLSHLVKSSSRAHYTTSFLIISFVRILFTRISTTNNKYQPSFGFSPRHCIVHPSQQQQTHILCVSALFIFFFPNFLSYVCVRECLVDGLSAKADGQTQKVWDKKNQFFLFIFLGLVKICNWTNETMAGGVQGASIDRSVWLFATERIIM